MMIMHWSEFHQDEELFEAWERMTYGGLRVPIEFVKQHPARMYYGLLKESVSATLDNVFDALEQGGWARMTL